MEKIDYAAVVTDLEAKCMQVDAAIAGLEKLKATRAGIVSAITALRKVIAGENSTPEPKAATAKP